MNISRRWFIGGAASFGALSGCRVLSGSGFAGSGAPRLTFGVVSDIHIKDLAKPGDKAVGCGPNELSFVHTLEWFRDQGVDGVVIAGDMADSGTIAQLQNVATAWFRVFPNDRAPDGRKVEKLFVYGNHDMGGVPYARHALKMPDASEADFAPLIIYPNPKAAWEKAFHEPFEPIWTKTVRGYRFVGAQWWSSQGCTGLNEKFNTGIADWYAKHAKEIDPSLPFFHIQHPHPNNTCYGPWAWGRDDGMSTRALSAFPNAVAFSGHSHYSLTDERSLWQGAFTSVGTSSLRYTGLEYNEYPDSGFENTSTVGESAHLCDAQKMTPRMSTADCRQGMLWKIYDDCITVRRREFVSDLDVGEAWTIPLLVAESKPFAFAERAKKIGAPAFPAGAALVVTKVTGKTRGAKKGRRANQPEIASVMKEALKIEIPAAVAQDGARAYQFEIEIAAGGKKVFRRIAAEGFNHAAKHTSATAATTCILALDALPKGELDISVTSVNCFGRRGTRLETRFSVS